MHGVHERQVETADDLVLGLRELAVPALQLAGDVVLLATELAQTDCIHVDRMDRGEHVDDRLARPSPILDAQVRRIRSGADHSAFDEVHDVERRAVDAVVRAESDGLRYGHIGAPERTDDAVLPGDVVGRREDLSEGRTPQHPTPAPGAVGGGLLGHRERQVGVSAGDEVEPERQLHVAHVLREPRAHVLGVDSVQLIAHVPVPRVVSAARSHAIDRVRSLNLVPCRATGRWARSARRGAGPRLA